MKVRILSFLTAFLLAAVLLSPAVRAACVSPAGDGGTLKYNIDSAQMEYCNGTNWVAFPKGNNSICATVTVWSPSAAAEANAWSGITYGNGTYVAFSIGGTNRVMTSPDGITWTARAAAQANAWYSAAYGNGTFVALSTDGTNRVMTSPDGITWTARNATEANQWYGVVYGNNQFVAVSLDGTNRVMTSPDGITWTARAAAQPNQWTDVAYGNGVYVAVSANGTNRVMTSPDGITWTVRNAAEANAWVGVTFGNGLFVAVSNTGTNRVMTSPDGITWTARSVLQANQWWEITYGNGMFVAVSNDGVSRVMRSTDGINWTAMASPEANGWKDVVFGDGKFVAVADSGTNRVMRSTCNSTTADWANATKQIDLVNPTNASWDYFGYGLATDGVKTVVGSSENSSDGNAHVFDNSTGALLLTLTNPNASGNDFFSAVAMDGNLIVVGAWGEDTGGTDAGRAYVFNATTGALVSTLINPAPDLDDRFGTAVAISGNNAVVSAPNDDAGGSNSGRAYVFNATTGALVSTIANPTPAADDIFGSDIAIAGNIVAVTAPQDDTGGSQAGRAYTFNATTGTLIATLPEPSASANAYFGGAVAIEDQRVLVGRDNGGSMNQAYIFDANTGFLLTTIPQTVSMPGFGSSGMALKGDLVFIGAGGDTPNPGVVYIFSASTGAPVSSISNPYPDNGDNFGATLALKGTTLVIGAKRDGGPGAVTDTGRAYVYSAYSYCSNPTQPNGSLMYNQTHRVIQWCDGSNWHAAGPIGPTGPNSGCSTPTGTGGDIMFNSTASVMQYCDGDNWRHIGGIDLCLGASPGAGTICKGGSIYAGLTPDGNVRMFATPTDAAALAWSGSSVDTMADCGAAPTAYTGEANTTLLAGLAGSYPAAEYCDALVAYGYDDWYMPARDELLVLYTNRNAGAFSGTFNLTGAKYISSCESNSFGARTVSFDSGATGDEFKTTANIFRCVRK